MILVKKPAGERRLVGSVGGSDLDLPGPERPSRVIWVWIQVDPDFWV